MEAVHLDVPKGDVASYLADGAPAPRVVIVAGSGLGGLGDLVDDAQPTPFGDLAGFPEMTSGVAGHASRLVGGSVGGVPVAVFQGRAHQYQGVSAYGAAYPARFAAAAGASTLIVTNAAGGVGESMHTGDVVLLSDHINLTGTNPLIGWPGPEGGVPFVPMRDAYDPRLRSIAREAAAEESVALVDGVYAGLLGPSYETPAEVAYLRTIGADVVGMSTIPEVICARALGLAVLGFSLVTNVAGGEGLSHEEVLEAGAHAEAALTRLMLAILRKL